MVEAGPRPVLRLLNQSAPDRVAVHVAELFDPLFMATHGEVVVSPLPEADFARPFELS